MSLRDEDEATAKRLLGNLGVEPHYGAVVCVLSVILETRIAAATAYRKAGGVCSGAADCGGKCWLPKGHDGECLCAADTDGPGSCPA